MKLEANLSISLTINKYNFTNHQTSGSLFVGGAKLSSRLFLKL